MRLEHNRLFVPITLGEHTSDIILDTGGDHNVGRLFAIRGGATIAYYMAMGTLSHATAEAVHARALASEGSHLSDFGGVTGIGGHRGAYRATVRHVKLGTVFGNDVPFDVLGGEREHGQDNDLLGINFFADYDVDLDIKGGKLTLYRGEGHCDRPITTLSGDLYTVPMLAEPNDNGVWLDVVVSGKHLHALLDTGSSHTALLADGAEKLNLQPTDGVKRVLATGVGPRLVQAYTEVSAPMQVGGVSMSNARILVVPDRLPPIDMFLGMDFITHTHVWISNSSRTLVIQVPPAPSPPTP